MTGRPRSGGGAGRSPRSQRGGVGRGRRNAGTPRPIVLTNAAVLAAVELLEEDDGAQDQECKLLACPFYKNDPLRHRECMKYNLTSVNYVKQHLHRCHGLAPYCPTCYANFDDTDSCNTHIVARVCDGPPPGVQRPVGVDAAQRSELNRRVKRTLSLEEQWLEVYRILFGRDAPRPASVYKGDPIVEVTATIDVIWESNARAIVNEALATEPSGPEAYMLMADAIVKGLLGRTRSLASQPASQDSFTTTATFSRTTTALNSQVGGGAPGIKSEPSQTDRLQPVPLDPDLYTPAPNNTLAHDNTAHADNTYLELAAVAAATYTPDPAPAPTYPMNHAVPPAYTTDPMTIDSPKANLNYLTDLALSPSPEPEQQPGPSRGVRRKRKTPTSLSASSRSGSLDSGGGIMTLDSPTFTGWRVGF
ncbi:hypothetical protein QBC39DRAFT_357044 [Podospora conica]|nr:hypothetical protein QBC39DRAFT_357044 [Schizothecium conicum]